MVTSRLRVLWRRASGAECPASPVCTTVWHRLIRPAPGFNPKSTPPILLDPRLGGAADLRLGLAGSRQAASIPCRRPSCRARARQGAAHVALAARRSCDSASGSTGEAACFLSASQSEPQLGLAGIVEALAPEPGSICAADENGTHPLRLAPSKPRRSYLRQHRLADLTSRSIDMSALCRLRSGGSFGRARQKERSRPPDDQRQRPNARGRHDRIVCSAHLSRRAGGRPSDSHIRRPNSH